MRSRLRGRAYCLGPPASNANLRRVAAAPMPSRARLAYRAAASLDVLGKLFRQIFVEIFGNPKAQAAVPAELALGEPLRRHQTGNGAPRLGNHDFLAGLHAGEERRKVSLCLVDVHTFHDAL